MGRRRKLFLGSIIGAVSLLVAPRAGDARRGVRCGRFARRWRGASLTAFADTPCSAERAADTTAKRVDTDISASISISTDASASASISTDTSTDADVSAGTKTGG